MPVDLSRETRELAPLKLRNSMVEADREIVGKYRELRQASEAADASYRECVDQFKALVECEVRNCRGYGYSNEQQLLEAAHRAAEFKWNCQGNSNLQKAAFENLGEAVRAKGLFLEENCNSTALQIEVLNEGDEVNTSCLLSKLSRQSNASLPKFFIKSLYTQVERSAAADTVNVPKRWYLLKSMLYVFSRDDRSLLRRGHIEKALKITGNHGALSSEEAAFNFLDSIRYYDTRAIAQLVGKFVKEGMVKVNDRNTSQARIDQL